MGRRVCVPGGGYLRLFAGWLHSHSPFSYVQYGQLLQRTMHLHLGHFGSLKYPGLPGDRHHALAEKYLPGGTCGVVSLGVKGGREAASRFMAGLKLASIATHVADAKTCVLHPASATHRQMNDEELSAAGISPDLVRFSVGIEDVNDILFDMEQALAGV